jgi:hypothetical protein
VTKDEVRAWFVDQGWGIGERERLLHERLTGIMDEGEAPELVMVAMHGFRQGHAVLTTKRLVFLAPAADGLTATQVDRAAVTGAKASGFLSARITIQHQGGTMKLVNVPRAVATRMVKALGY